MHKFTIQLLLLLAVMCSVSFFVPSAFAAKLSLGINPPLIKIKTVPGSHVQIPLTISNYGDNPVNLLISIKPFTDSAKHDGEIQFLRESRQMKNFISGSIEVLEANIPIAKLLLAPQQKESLIVDLKIPKDHLY